MTWARLATAILAILAAGCATRGSVRHLRTELNTMRAELAAARQAQETTAREAADAASEAKSADSRVRELSAALRETAQQVTQLRARLSDTEEGLTRVRTDFAARAGAAAPPPPAASPPPAPPPSAPPPVAPPPVAPSSPAADRPVREAAPRPGAAEAAYSAALTTFRAREHGQAVLEFMDFVAKYPRHALAPNAQYWIGEAYYVQHDYQQALSEFQKVLDVDAGTGKAADALLKIGLCYVNLHEPTRAQQTWQRVLREHPNSEAAGRARALLRSRRATSR